MCKISHCSITISFIIIHVVSHSEYSQFYSSSDSEENLKIKTLQNKKTTTQIDKQMTSSTTDKQNASYRQLFPVEISSWHCQNLKKSVFKFTSACLLNRLQILLSFAINFCRNFAVRTSIWQVIGRKWKSVWRSLTTAIDPVWSNSSNFINERVKGCL